MNIVTTSASPFDSIRKFDSQGNEFWNARELMSMLGYPRWNEFLDVIEKGKASCKNGGNVVTDHFSGLLLKTSGRSKEDYKLSRLASYLVAQNGDPRKPEIAAAQAYFAIKTREAETVIPALSEKLQLALLENENLKLQVQIGHNQRYLLDKSEAIAQIQGVGMLALILNRPDAVVEKIEKVTETIIVENGRSVSFEGKSTAEMAKELGFKTGVQLENWLRTHKADHLVCEGFRKVGAAYIPTENIKEVKKLWSKNKDRQLLIGE